MPTSQRRRLLLLEAHEILLELCPARDRKGAVELYALWLILYDSVEAHCAHAYVVLGLHGRLSQLNENIL
jgi:hypothetical protein